MDPTKAIGRVKEVVRKEHKSRSNYPLVWNEIASSETNKFYHQDELDKQLKEKLQIQEVQTNTLEICRCGRPKEYMHMSKCLQRAYNPILSEEETESKNLDSLPQTSNCFIGWRNASYRKMEQSMQHVSPKNSMPGPRITSAPYNVIFIG